MQRGAIAFDRRFEGHVAAGAKDGRAMIPEEPVDEDDITRTRQMRSEGHAFADHANSRRCEEQLVASASLHHLGIPGDDLDACLFRRTRHRTRYLPQQIDGHAFFDDHRAGKVEWLCSADREIIDGPADCKLADIATRKVQRVYHEGIRSEGKPIAMRGKL